jgi:hypothetical protein
MEHGEGAITCRGPGKGRAGILLQGGLFISRIILNWPRKIASGLVNFAVEKMAKF